MNADSLLWTRADTNRALMASIAPVGLGLAHYLALRPGHHAAQFYKSSAKPDWASDCPQLYGLVDLATLSPLGYASYLVYKNGGGLKYNDMKMMLGLYGVSLLFFGACRPLYEHRDYKWLAINKAISFASAVGFTYFFNMVIPQAAYLSIPYTVVSGLTAILFYKLYTINDPHAKRL